MILKHGSMQIIFSSRTPGPVSISYRTTNLNHGDFKAMIRIPNSPGDTKINMETAWNLDPITNVFLLSETHQ
ncbi:hypothetical protein V144x_55950 [Gimesia aquarii]|uniref:Uncharacterized protein n=1 Tax=Gimesia aquarii TaxID=2527964 RepID=A0A517W496_9PLAN|nr:hypothetical protein V144x_55950 [Gimesia aquarii]